jgi:hypothetical protein
MFRNILLSAIALSAFAALVPQSASAQLMSRFCDDIPGHRLSVKTENGSVICKYTPTPHPQKPQAQNRQPAPVQLPTCISIPGKHQVGTRTVTNLQRCVRVAPTIGG